ncbi:type VII secretion protein EccB [Nocardiopsis ansamitocini]|uniref:Type VII secretion protein EccB n=1 Tax=Nocardiopsis ansamitocini TaxID=1670832 RepID=A0A9W6PBI0_9ACTN|nr:type VII secretion protein EccB [Nocardiopsis ansamitocini]GLU50467.1 type VII secretion protein EccB [Nocardiopsis ansamitocini]
MQSRRDRVQAHTFMVGRLGTAMLEGDPNAVDAPMRRTRTGSFIGLALSALVCVGFLVFGLIFPGGANSWRQDGKLIVEKETGATYLYAGGMLRPVANYASAKLIQGNKLSVSSVSMASLEGEPKGGPVGIPGAPDSLPDAEEAAAQVWRLCAVPPTADYPPRTSLTVDAGNPSTRIAHDMAVLVSSPDGDHHLLWQDTRLRLDTGNGALEALGYGTSPVLPVTAPFLASVPPGPELTAPDVAGLGEDGPVLGGRQTVVGQVFVVPGEGDERQHYLLGQDGLSPLTATDSRLLLANSDIRDEAYGGSAPTAVELPAGEVQGNLAAGSEVGRPSDSPVPGTPPALFPVELETPCLQLGGDGSLELVTHPVDGIRAWPPQETPSIAPGCPTPELIGIAAGGGGLAAGRPAGGSTATPTYYLVTDSAAKYPVPDADTVSALGFDPAAAVEVPTSLLRLVPTGPLLSPAAAALPVAPSARVENTDCPQ